MKPLTVLYVNYFGTCFLHLFYIYICIESYSRVLYIQGREGYEMSPWIHSKTFILNTVYCIYIFRVSFIPKSTYLCTVHTAKRRVRIVSLNSFKDIYTVYGILYTHLAGVFYPWSSVCVPFMLPDASGPPSPLPPFSLFYKHRDTIQ